MIHFISDVIIRRFCRQYARISEELVKRSRLDNYTRVLWFVQGLKSLQLKQSRLSYLLRSTYSTMIQQHLLWLLQYHLLLALSPQQTFLYFHLLCHPQQSSMVNFSNNIGYLILVHYRWIPNGGNKSSEARSPRDRTHRRRPVWSLLFLLLSSHLLFRLHWGLHLVAQRLQLLLYRLLIRLLFLTLTAFFRR